MTAKKKNSLVGNINKRKKAGRSRSKKNSTVSRAAYKDLKKGWGKRSASSKRKGSKASK